MYRAMGVEETVYEVKEKNMQVETGEDDQVCIRLGSWFGEKLVLLCAGFLNFEKCLNLNAYERFSLQNNRLGVLFMRYLLVFDLEQLILSLVEMQG